MEFSYKFFREGDVLLAVADKHLLGKTFRGEVDITISKEFYHEDFCSKEELLEMIKEASIVNAMGKNIVDFLLKEGFVDEKSVKNPAGVPHVQIVIIS